jgi:hypothetical protein
MLRRKPQQHVIERAKIEVGFFWWAMFIYPMMPELIFSFN